MSDKRLYALRGAAQCINAAEDIRRQVSLLYDSLLKKNNLAEDDIVSVIFSLTSDLDALNPAAALRQTGRAGALALFAAQEAETADVTLPRVLRVLVHCYLPEGSKPCHVYQNGAEILRPDRVVPDRVGLL
jgi:chorismate mutase